MEVFLNDVDDDDGGANDDDDGYDNANGQPRWSARDAVIRSTPFQPIKQAINQPLTEAAQSLTLKTSFSLSLYFPAII